MVTDVRNSKMFKLPQRIFVRLGQSLFSDVLTLRHFSVDVAGEPNIYTNPPIEDVGQRVLNVAIVGMPNAGKSTIINTLMDRKICPVSTKVHTTRARASAIMTEDDSQIIFLDTPGIVSDRELKKMNLERAFLRDVRRSMHHADLIGVIHDVGNHWTRERIDIKIIKLLTEYYKKKSVLILNKIDMLKSKRKLLDLTRLLTNDCIDGKPVDTIKKNRLLIADEQNGEEDETEYRAWPNFSEIFMISATDGSGVDDLRQFILKSAKPGEWLYPPEIYTDQHAEDIIVQSVKAQLLNYLKQEIPYSLIPLMEFFEQRIDGSMKAVVIVKCPTERIKNHVCGTSDGRLRQIITSVQRDVQSAFNCRVSLQIIMQSPK